MGAVFVGVRHHSPACARLVASTIRELRPAHVLVEGPADVNGRLDELLLGHELPIAIFTYLRDGDRSHASWTPFCDYSPEWLALTTGREVGARVSFIDLPAWHPAFAERGNRYADAELRYAEVVDRLCREFAVDNVDALWDHLVEVADPEGLAERLTAYFDLVRGATRIGDTRIGGPLNGDVEVGAVEVGHDDAAREAHMAAWVRAAVADAGDRPVVVVTGGFHTPALRELVRTGGDAWPEVPAPPPGARGASYLVPYSHQRLDAFTGYQSGMPSPEYYHRLWTDGAAGAATALVESVVARLRQRRQPVSTADLIAARTQAEGLARLRGHAHPSRVDVLDGLVSALVSEDLAQPPPWSARGPLAVGTHPAVVEVVAALSGDRVGRLHPTTPTPPLVGDVGAELSRLGLDGAGRVSLDLTDPRDLTRSRVLHRLRVLGVPGFHRRSGPSGGGDPVAAERWHLEPVDTRLPALVEAAAHGATLAEAAAAALHDRVPHAGVAALAGLLFDAALCGVDTLSSTVTDTLTLEVARAADLGALGAVLTDVLGLWRHDWLLGSAGSPVLGGVLDAAVTRALWLAEGVRGGPAPADPARLRALVGTRDALVHAAGALEVDRARAVAVMRRVAATAGAPPDLRGAAFGFAWSLDGPPPDHVAVVRDVAAPSTLGDWLAGLFAVARQEVLTDEAVVGALDEVVGELSEEDFLVALPALRQAFAHFPPAEREAIASVLLARRGSGGSARALVRTSVDPLLVAEARALEAKVDAVLVREGLA
ncbi:DUF5682 family protein [Saccharothrix yanglingensis]|uniref:Uncharacterized protein n=1 Tax=Saccharothrix yanglingensis TaxID=659496 RepID=A0ABU0WW12_9PSEU|nr:DUF5682 family protein [Saccharothrix yanglingensis]MDQ2584048.1 hypothetical protein [Saccharothrix yanglingensis]